MVSFYRDESTYKIHHKDHTHFQEYLKVYIIKLGNFVSGARVRIERDLGSSGDDTAMNGIRLLYTLLK